MTLQEKADKILELLEEVKREVKQKDAHLFEQWKAGGFIIDPDIMSMYPDLTKVAERLSDENEDTGEDDQ